MSRTEPLQPQDETGAGDAAPEITTAEANATKSGPAKAEAASSTATDPQAVSRVKDRSWLFDRRAGKKIRRFTAFGFLVVAISTTLIWLLAISAVDANRRLTLEQAQMEMRQTGQLVARQTELVLKRANDAIAIIAQVWRSDPDRFDLSRTVAGTGLYPELVQNIVIADADGRAKASLVKTAPDFSMAQLPHFITARNQRGETPFVSRTDLGRIVGHPAIRLVRPLRTSDGGFQGLILASFSPRRFIEAFIPGQMKTRDVLMVIGHDGFIRTRDPSQEGCEATDFSDEPRFKAIIANGDAAFVEAPCPYDGVQRLWWGVPVRDFPLVVAVGRDRERVLRQHMEFRRLVLVAAVAATLTVVGFVAIMLRHLHSEARAAAELEGARRRADAANAAKSRFLASMSHELRTPLNAVIGFSEMIAGQYLGPIGNARYAEYGQDIARAARHLHDLLSNVLDLSKIEAGRVTIEPKPVRVDEAVAQAIRIAAGILPRGAALLVDETQGCALAVQADPRALQQVLLNFLSNAVKFTPDGGRVTVRAAPATASAVEITVADTGIGIPRERIAQVLEPYGQLDTGAPHAMKGTGLGLTIARELLTRMRGSMTLDSTFGQGTVVRFVLPRATGVPAAAPSSP